MMICIINCFAILLVLSSVNQLFLNYERFNTGTFLGYYIKLKSEYFPVSAVKLCSFPEESLLVFTQIPNLPLIYLLTKLLTISLKVLNEKVRSLPHDSVHIYSSLHTGLRWKMLTLCGSVKMHHLSTVHNAPSLKPQQIFGLGRQPSFGLGRCLIIQFRLKLLWAV